MKYTMFWTVSAIASTTLCAFLSHTFVKAAETQEVTIRFSAMVGDQPFRCGMSYSLGTPATPVTPTDFRFYVSEVALIDANGNAVPVSLQQDGKWQFQNVALLDFEDKSGDCTNGTEDMRDRIIGTVPSGSYKGLKFTLGVPFDLNHADSTLAASPLNLTSLWWNWRGGYKFLRVDLKNAAMAQMPSPGASEQATAEHHNAHSRVQPIGQAVPGGHGSHGAAGQGDHHAAPIAQGASGHGASERGTPGHGAAPGESGFSIHLGSTGCQAAENNQAPTSCVNPNQVNVVFENFDLEQNQVVADLARLVANSNLQMNQPNTPPGCMSALGDRDCVGVMSSLGLPYEDQSAQQQTFFQIKVED
ncbi:MAG: metallo-mystery pair system four-Cys motif protein [Oculatellaceae cyanobacterium Prado106]|jgi:hypothetical protein|nr:metallo-mystery pair system four-Cys motif protein [Oculatellaceae cyanobacterium Prado106]